MNLPSFLEKDDLVRLMLVYANGSDGNGNSSNDFNGHWTDFNCAFGRSSMETSSGPFSSSSNEPALGSHSTDASNSTKHSQLDSSTAGESESTTRPQTEMENVRVESPDEDLDEQIGGMVEEVVEDVVGVVVQDVIEDAVQDAVANQNTAEISEASVQSTDKRETLRSQEVQPGNPITNTVPSTSDTSTSHTEAPATGRQVEIEELSGSDFSPTDGPEPLVMEIDDTPSNDATVTTPAERTTISEVREEPSPDIQWFSGLVVLSDIKKMSDLEYLTVKQLKHLLFTNCVDYKGCIERRELVDRASRLWQEYKQAQTVAVEELHEGDVCKICWDAPIECVILECGHMACCLDCGKRMAECPICKGHVVRVVRFFKA